MDGRTKAVRKRQDTGSRLTGHALLDARSLALGELTARRLRERPELMAVARRILKRWQGMCAANVQPVLREWETILDAGIEETVATLTGSEERHIRLRQSAPFAGEEIITREERNALWRQFAP
jgi:hypothetical protein